MENKPESQSSSNNPKQNSLDIIKPASKMARPSPLPQNRPIFDNYNEEDDKLIEYLD